MNADRKDRRQIRAVLFAASVFGVPCLWVPIASVGIYPLVVLVVAMFLYGPVLGVLTLIHVVLYAGVFFAVAHVAAAAICRSSTQRVRPLVTIGILGLIAVLPFLPIWGGASHGGEFPSQSAFEATRPLLGGG